MTNRALMVAALAAGTTRLTNTLFSDDSHYFAKALVQLGFSVHFEPEFTQQSRPDHYLTTPSMTVVGQNGRIPAGQADLYIGNAGTAARFLTAMLTLGNGHYILDGDSRMRQRPMQDLFTALGQLGAVITIPISNHPMGEEGIHLPVSIQAQGLYGGQAGIAGDASSQFLSGLLLAAPYAQHAVELVVERNLTSKPFVEMTLAVMADFGVFIERDGYHRFRISPQTYHSPGTYTIECDATAASYFFSAPAICGGTVKVEGITRHSKQGDIAFLDVLVQMGCTVAEVSDGISVTGPPGEPGLPLLRGVTVNMGDISDTAQTLVVLAPFASTPTTIYGIASSRRKETDRVAAICTELSHLGVRVDEHPDGLTIYPCRDFHPAIIQTYRDHRMAMAFSMLGLKIPGITILDPGCVSKTFPNFYKVLAQLQT